MRPWYVYLITVFTVVILLVTAIRLLVAWSGATPGAAVDPAGRRVVRVRPGSPLAGAGLQVGDRLGDSSDLDAGPRIRRKWVVAHWRDVPKQPVQVPVWRAGRWIQLQVRPQPTP